MNEIEQIVKKIVGDYSWFIIGAFAMIWFKNAIENFFQGFITFFGNDLNEDDILYINGRKSRVSRVGFRKTIFYMYGRNAKMIVPNERLKHLTIEKMLPTNGDGKNYESKCDGNCSKCKVDN